MIDPCRLVPPAACAAVERHAPELLPLVEPLLWAGLAALLTSTAMLFAYRGVVRAGWVEPVLLPQDEESRVRLTASPWAGASACEACGAVLPLLARLPAVGWLRACRCGHRGPALYPVCEAAAALLAALLCPALPLPAAAALLAGILGWAALASADRVAFSAPAFLLFALFWLALLGSPFVPLDARVTGAAVLFALVAASHGATALWMALRKRAPGVLFGAADWVAVCTAGAWLGTVPGVLALVTGCVHFALRHHRRSGPGPFLPSLALGCAVAALSTTLPRSLHPELLRVPLVLPWL